MTEANYLAEGNQGTLIKLPMTKHPRARLLDRLGATSAQKTFVDHKDGTTTRHDGYVVRGEWFTIHRVVPFKAWGET